MIIAESAIQMYSERTAVERQASIEQLTVWQGNQEPEVQRAENGRGRKFNPRRELNRAKHDTVTLSHKHQVRHREVQTEDIEQTEDQELMGDLNTRLLRAMFEKLTGRKFRMIDPAQFTSVQTDATAQASDGEPVEPVDAQQESSGFGLAYDYHEMHYESEKTSFAASGTIATADGQTIDFNIGLSMSREYYSEQNIQIRAGDALKDPLVINFAGTAAQLTQRDFFFDIDADGSKDQIAFVGEGSGMLALDKNEDGTINDGSELFGAITGNGFAELSAYDTDGNSWIDENDAVYENLRIWTRNSEGEDSLLALGAAGVGAIYLGHVETMFSMKDMDNSLVGQVRETGLAVMETGQVVTMQQLDLVA